MTRQSKNRLVLVALITLGTVQMAADLVGLPIVKGIAAAWGASPAPKVFSSARGLETFSSGFEIRWKDSDDDWKSARLTPEIYQRLEGPYNRRNAYGAAFAYGPVLAADAATASAFEQVTRFAFCPCGGLLQELGLGDEALPGPFEVVIHPKPSTNPDPELPLRFEIRCDEIDGWRTRLGASL